ncbi:MAG: S-ribosylhomocysteine lyase [Clostridia bacterium]|nr:S-ribosylhomocysteine lyase [Clostridia bacterium]
MNKIESFKINHDILERGIYISRIDGDVITYDIRVKKPNGGDYLKTDVMHTIEHVFATFVRNSIYSDNVIYFGPMGCRTGFYLLLRDSVGYSDVINLTKDAFNFIADFEGEIPGNSKIECGNYLEHDLKGAKEEAKIMADVIKNWKEADMKYKEV